MFSLKSKSVLLLAILWLGHYQRNRPKPDVSSMSKSMVVWEENTSDDSFMFLMMSDFDLISTQCSTINSTYPESQIVYVSRPIAQNYIHTIIKDRQRAIEGEKQREKDKERLRKKSLVIFEEKSHYLFGVCTAYTIIYHPIISHTDTSTILYYPMPSYISESSRSFGSFCFVFEFLSEFDFEPVSEPVSEPVLELISEPVFEPVSEPVSEAVSEPVSEAVFDHVFRPVCELVSEPDFQPDSEPVSEPVSQPVCEAVSEANSEADLDHVFRPVCEPDSEADFKSSSINIPTYWYFIGILSCWYPILFYPILFCSILYYPVLYYAIGQDITLDSIFIAVQFIFIFICVHKALMSVYQILISIYQNIVLALKPITDVFVFGLKFSRLVYSKFTSVHKFCCGLQQLPEKSKTDKSKNIPKQNSLGLSSRIVMWILITFAFHYLVHMSGSPIRVSCSRALGCDKHAIDEYIGKIPYIGMILGQLNQCLNVLVKKGGIFLQPAVFIGLKRLVRNTKMRSLQIIITSVLITAMGSSVYYCLFSRSGLFHNSFFDPSGHALLGFLNIFNMCGIKPADIIEKRINAVWAIFFLISASNTIIFYHTIAEYLTGILMAYIGFYMLCHWFRVLVDAIWSKIEIIRAEMTKGRRLKHTFGVIIIGFMLLEFARN